MSEPVEIWEISFDEAGAVDWQLLDPRETAAADAFIHAEDRYRYGVIHTALRLRLSELLGIAAEAVPIVVGAHGRPFVAGRAAEIDFNLSHSRRTGLIAISKAGTVGVDVEDRDATADYSEMIDTIFEQHEALACIAWKNPSATIFSCGDGPARRRWRRLSERGFCSTPSCSRCRWMTAAVGACRCAVR